MFCAAASVLTYHASAFALMPPMEMNDLRRESTNIVSARVLDVKCTGEFEDNACVRKTGYVAKLKVLKTFKGERLGEFELRFKRYEFKDGCVGSPDTVHYPGEEARYYLSCKGEVCFLTHWNGITYTSRGSGKLPACEGKGRQDAR